MSNTQLATVDKIVYDVRDQFASMVADPSIKFEAEAEFAIQQITKNDYSIKLARGNPAAVQDAVRSVAAIGVTLNPAMAHAYLAPRDNKIQLIIGYRGFIHMALSSGQISLVHAELVYSNDVYTPQGHDKQPLHEYSPFAKLESRGELVGVYVTAKRTNGDWITDVMSAEDVMRIRDRSESWKAHVASKHQKKTPWVTDMAEMWKKTVIRRAYKSWPLEGPAAERMAKAVEHSNQVGEGINFEAEQQQSAGQGAPAAAAKPEKKPFQLREYLKQIAACNSPAEVKKLRRDGQAIASANEDKYAYDEITRCSRVREAFLTNNQGVSDAVVKEKANV
jgi:recombination protein RecT